MKKEIKEKIREIIGVNKNLTVDNLAEHKTCQILELFEDEYKNGYNQCLRDLGKTGERWLHLYL